MLAEAMEVRAETLRIMAADNLRGHRKFRNCPTIQGQGLAEWYEGRYMAYKKAAEMIRETLEMYA